MQANLQSFFDLSSGKSPRQQEIEDLYTSVGIDLEPIFNEAFKRTLENNTPTHFRGRGFMADRMNDNLIGLMRETHNDRMFQDEFGRWYLLLIKDTRIYFKKLDRKYRPSNIVTKHVDKLNSGNLLFHQEPITVLYAGFKLRLDKFWDEMEGCFLVEMRNTKRTNFVSFLNELSAIITKESQDIITISTVEIPDEIIVTPKTKPGSKEIEGLAG